MRTRLLAVALTAAVAAIVLPTTAYAAPAPITDANLKTLDPTSACVRGAARPVVNGLHPRLQAFVPSDGTSASVQFRVTNTADGTEIFTGESSQKLTGTWYEPGLAPNLVDATTYAWQARVVNNTGTSAWSNPCELTVDIVRPNSPDLTVSPGPYKVGQQITLTFGNAGSTDVVDYGYSLGTDEPTGHVAVCPGKVKLKLTSSGPTTIKAWAFDRAGNRSAGPTEVRISVGS
ncbi:hypothetical protein [Kribbella sp. NPDC055071]